ncbi:aspartate dehydrogenase [Sporosarcina sp. BI001-red]|uniref:aspartate dehydrogenase n=1 Tax=Sporosarcina sp. BI001-red TaxID=2282866 RepID=UPI000E25DEC4|nr:aspartate dehydrogenase [Sporosarcina sp. BI001-red]REB05236.1 aspartate dehydrogenase [Sporosarcina sp. BI001-red]
MKIGIIGTGNIATYLLEEISRNTGFEGEIVALFGRNQEVGNQLSEKFGVDFYTDLHSFLNTDIDIVVEAATVEAASVYVKDVVEDKKNLVISSIGVFKAIRFYDELKGLAESNDVTIYLPSGAIGGLDLLQSANAVNGLERVKITTRKSPASLGLNENHKEEVLFDGSAREAIERFPKNVNVALVLAIAGVGVEETKVCVIVDPSVTQNIHTIEAEGDFGKMHLQVENNPMPNNPKTSLLAALSILSTLQNKDRAVKIGS